jgi:thiosulfate/3-mercaptopyruvate sulfurtransferase
VGTDEKGLPYFKCKETKMLFKVGLNPNKTKDRPYNFVVLRHPPADPRLFDSYDENALSHFDDLPTWKLDTPHSIQRTTPQNRTCNSCHGNVSLFLQEGDLAGWEQRANAKVIVPANNIPKPVKEVTK